LKLFNAVWAVFLQVWFHEEGEKGEENSVRFTQLVRPRTE
jgi:hypothetical protein